MQRFLLVAALCLMAAPNATGTPANQGALRVASTTPVTVVGSRFKAKELVRVVVTVDARATKRAVRATLRGRFTVAFAGVTVADPCSSELRVHAIGARGTRASAKVPMPMCPPTLLPPG